MIKANKVKVGCYTYKVLEDCPMNGAEMGSICQATGDIKIKRFSYNGENVTKEFYFFVLCHEIVHALDVNVMFSIENKEENHEESENAIDLVATYIIRNLNNIIKNREEQYNDFALYIDACEIKSTRIGLLFSAIIDLFDDNKDLIGEFVEVFG